MNNEDDDIAVIDQYNKLQILHNIFSLFLLKSSQTTDIELQSIISSFQSMESNFFLLHQPPDDSIGLLFTDLMTIKNLSNTNMPMNTSFKLLSYFEEEIRVFLKSHRNLLTLDNDNNVSKLITIPSDVLMLLLDNFNIFTSIYSTYFKNHTSQKQNILNSMNVEYTEINSVINSITNIILTQLTSEQNIKTLQKIKESLTEKNKKAFDEINFLSAQLDKYKLQGDSMTGLVNEYNKLCNMIDCSK